MNASLVGIVVFASTFGAAMLATRLHTLLPKHYFDSESKDTVKVGIGLIATMTALARLRKEAAKRGLNPNVWFHNVEYVAAEKIGAEPVTYVSNIYKYYIAYKLIMEQKADREQAAEKLKNQTKAGR